MTRPRSRTLDRLLIATFVSAWLLLFVPSLYRALTSGASWYPHLSFAAESASEYPAFYGGTPNESPRSPSPIQPGDRWIRVEGRDLRGVSYFDIKRAMRDKMARREALRLEIERDGRRIYVVITPVPDPLWWPFVPAAAGSVLAASFLLLRAPRWRLGRRYFVAMLLFCLYAETRIAGPVLEALGEIAFKPAAMALLLGFAAELTEAARPIRSWQRVGTWVVGGMQALLWAGAIFLPLYLGALIDRPELPRMNEAAWGLLLLVSASRAYRLAGALERRQLKWILYGLFVGTLPLTALSLVAVVGVDLVGVDLWAWAPAAIACFAAIPAGLVVAVVGYRWLDIDRLISATASYTIVGLAVLGGALAVVPRLALAAAPVVGIDMTVAQWLLTMLLVGAAIPVHRFLRALIDQRLFAERHQRTLGFERLLDEIGGYASVEELVRLAAERVDALLEPESIALYARDGTSFAPLFARGRATPPAFDADGLLVRALEPRGRPLWADAPELDAFDRATLETLGVALVVPTRGRDGVVAFACLGPKRSGDIYTPEEIAQLGAVADRCSAVLLQHVGERSAPGNAVPHLIFSDATASSGRSPAPARSSACPT